MTKAVGQGSYEIGRTTGRCAATDEPLSPGDPIVAALVEAQDSEGFARLDFALDAWAGGARPPASARVFGFWRTVVAEPNANKRPAIDAEGLLGLFEQLADDEVETVSPERSALRYLIALVLVRKRELVLDRVDRDGDVPVLLVRPKGVAHREDPPTRVPEPGAGVEVEPLLEQLGEALNLDTDGL